MSTEAPTPTKPSFFKKIQETATSIVAFPGTVLAWSLSLAPAITAEVASLFSAPFMKNWKQVKKIFENRNATIILNVSKY